MTILEAAESGTHMDLLVALRNHIARTIDDGCAARDLVGLSKRLVDLVREIEAIDAASSPLRLVSNRERTFDPEAL